MDIEDGLFSVAIKFHEWAFALSYEIGIQIKIEYPACQVTRGLSLSLPFALLPYFLTRALCIACLAVRVVY